MSSAFDHALAFAARGFRVFPPAPNGEEPAIRGRQAAATGESVRLAAWWAVRNGPQE